MEVGGNGCVQCDALRLWVIISALDAWLERESIDLDFGEVTEVEHGASGRVKRDALQDLGFSVQSALSPPGIKLFLSRLETKLRFPFR